MTDRLLYTVREMAHLLHVSHETVRAACYAGEMEHSFSGRELRIRLEAAEAWVLRRERSVRIQMGLEPAVREVAPRKKTAVSRHSKPAV